MGTIGSLNIHWWTQDYREHVLGFTGALCWAVALTLLVGTVGLAIPSELMWYVVVPVRARLICVTVALLLLTLSAVVKLPGIRMGVITSIAIPAVFVGLGLMGNRAYVFENGSPWPQFHLIGDVLIALSFSIFVGYCGVAIFLLSGVRRWQLSAAICTAIIVFAITSANAPGLLAEVLTAMWTVPIAILHRARSGPRRARRQGCQPHVARYRRISGGRIAGGSRFGDIR